MTVKTFLMLQNIYIYFKCCSFELYSSKNPEKRHISQFSQKYEAAQLFSTFVIIIHVSCAVNQHIRIISEGSCDTEDWSNDTENSALNHRNKLHFNVY